MIFSRHNTRTCLVEAELGAIVKSQIKNSEFHLNPEELRQIIEAAVGLRDRLVVALFVYTGVRRAELQKIQVRDVDLARRRLLIRHGKGGKQRIVYLPDPIIDDLQIYYDGHKEDYLFGGQDGGPMSLRNINYIVSRVATSAGVKTPNPRYRNVGPHLLRHSFARNWKRASGSLESLQKILGHSSLKTTLDVYGCESQNETEENYRALVGRIAP
jgi:integrase/recombinase XerD